MEQNENASKRSLLDEAVDRAIEELPYGYTITIELEVGCGMATLRGPSGTETVIEGEGWLAPDVNEAIDKAIIAAKGEATPPPAPGERPPVASNYDEYTACEAAWKERHPGVGFDTFGSHYLSGWLDRGRIMRVELFDGNNTLTGRDLYVVWQDLMRKQGVTEFAWGDIGTIAQTVWQGLADRIGAKVPNLAPNAGADARKGVVTVGAVQFTHDGQIWTLETNDGRRLAHGIGEDFQVMPSAESMKAADDAVCAARWREVLMHVSGGVLADSKHCFMIHHLRPIEGANILIGSVAQHFTEAVDAARAARNGAPLPPAELCAPDDIFPLIREWEGLPEGKREHVARKIIGCLNRSYTAGFKDGREIGRTEAGSKTEGGA